MLPHPTLTDHYASPEAKPEFVSRLFNAGAKHYDAVVDWGFLRTGSFYRRWAQQRHGLRPGMALLDVASGTGLMATAAAEILGGAAPITCIDPSEGMLNIARAKLPEARFFLGRAEELPFPDASFDFITMGYALRHVADLETPFREFRRVLRPGGKLLILEVTKPASRLGSACFRLYFRNLYPFFAGLFTRSRDARNMMRYYWETMDACVPPRIVTEALTSAGFHNARRDTQLVIFSEYSAVCPQS